MSVLVVSGSVFALKGTTIRYCISIPDHEETYKLMIYKCTKPICAKFTKNVKRSIYV